MFRVLRRPARTLFGSWASVSERLPANQLGKRNATPATLPQQWEQAVASGSSTDVQSAARAVVQLSDRLSGVAALRLLGLATASTSTALIADPAVQQARLRLLQRVASATCRNELPLSGRQCVGLVEMVWFMSVNLSSGGRNLRQAVTRWIRAAAPDLTSAAAVPPRTALALLVTMDRFQLELPDDSVNAVLMHVSRAAPAMSAAEVTKAMRALHRHRRSASGMDLLGVLADRLADCLGSAEHVTDESVADTLGAFCQSIETMRDVESDASRCVSAAS